MPPSRATPLYGALLERQFEIALWIQVFKGARDETPSPGGLWSKIKATVRELEWFQALDVLEGVLVVAATFLEGRSPKLAYEARDAANRAFEKYLVGFRFVEGRLAPIDSEVDREAVQEAMEAARDFSGAQRHLRLALERFADRESPDYANSVKESISAVESVVKKVTGESTLGAGLKVLERSGIAVHPALASAWAKIYGWTSDADGIRHASVEAVETDQAMARYMLVCSSAFVSYLIDVGRRGGLL